MKFFLALGLIWWATVVGKEIVKISTSVVVNNDMLPTLNKASEKRRCHNPNMWQEECKEGSKIFETYGPFRNKACDHICASIAQCKSFIYHTPTSSCGLLTVSGGTTKYHGISGPNLKLRLPNPIKSYNPAAKNCSSFTFAGCKEINAETLGMKIHLATSAKSCLHVYCLAQHAGVPNNCQSFFHEKTNLSCWNSRFIKPSEIVRGTCEITRGIVDIDDPSKYDECVGWTTSSSNKCQIGECDMKWLGDELKSTTHRGAIVPDEKYCKTLCSGYMPPPDDPNQDQVCTHYEFNSKEYIIEKSCKLFDGRKGKDQPLTCAAIVAAKNITDDEIDECQKETTEKLWRDDRRCGKGYFLDDGVTPAQCDPSPNQEKDAHGPCCSDKNWCGNSDAHCKCLTCVDYSPGNTACLDKPAEIAFVVDISYSMENAWPVVLRWLEALVDSFKIDGNTRKGGLVAWATAVHEPSTVRFTDHLTADEFKDWIKAIPTPESGSSTYGGAALDYTYKNLFETGSNPNVLREIVYITDGDTVATSPLPPAAEQFHTNHIRIRAVALGDFDTTNIMKMVCVPCGDHLFTNIHVDDLNSIGFLGMLTSCD